MAQNTLVLQLEPREQELLADRLKAGAFEARSVDHARFSVRGEGVVATLYNSGKLVVQGQDVELFLVRYVEASRAPEPSAAPTSAKEITRALVGSDETGKGDYFGPLVVVALRLGPSERAELQNAGIMDSKKLADSTVLRLAPALEARYAHAIEALDPPEYNREYARIENLNPLLADLHAAAIRRVAQPGDEVLVDRFAKESLVASRVADLEIDLRQEVRAERELAVAAASIVARGEFLDRLRKLSDDVALELPKGAGAPVDRAARDFVRLHGYDELPRVAKVHFKNTAKLGGRS